MMPARRVTRRYMICDHFFSHCDQSGGPDSCWPFMRSRNRHGYGRVWANGRCHEAHRFAYTITKGTIPPGLYVLHSCDNPACCNPKHLSVGDQRQNAKEREERGRGNQPKGEANSQAKLRRCDVVFIRRCKDLYGVNEMARMLGVTPSTVSKVLLGEAWAWMEAA